MSRYCKKCGLPLDEGTKYCPSCGEPVENVTIEEPAFDEAEKETEESKGFEQKAKEKFDEFNQTEDLTSSFDQKDIDDNKIISLFSYLGFLFIIPLIVANKSKFARFHINQGVVLFLADVILGLIMRTTRWVFVFTGLGWISAIVDALLGILLLVFTVLGIVNAVKGKAKRLPIIGKLDLFK